MYELCVLNRDFNQSINLYPFSQLYLEALDIALSQTNVCAPSPSQNGQQFLVMYTDNGTFLVKWLRYQIELILKILI